MGVWREDSVGPWAAWVGETDTLRLVVIPELGSKIVSLRYLHTGREWLWQANRALGHAGRGSAYGESDGSGWDEMFPTIDPCIYPVEPWQAVAVPDHGELWCLPWHVYVAGHGLECHVAGVRFPYQFARRLTVDRGTLRIDYRLKNESSSPFSFLWAAHPLFQVNPNTKICVEEGIRGITVSHSEENRLGTFGDEHPWPVAKGRRGPVQLDRMGRYDHRVAEKYYLLGPHNGHIALLDEQTGETLSMRFPPDKVPYLAVWMNCGAYRGDYNLALEPATGNMDSLQWAATHGQVSTVNGGGTCEWYMEIELNRQEGARCQETHASPSSRVVRRALD